MVPVAGRDLPGRPFQSPAVARSDQAGAVPGGRPVDSLLGGVSGSGGGGEPAVRCPPGARAGACVGSFTVTVVPLTFRYGFQGVVIGTAVPVVAGPTAVTLEPLVVATLAAARPSR